MCIYIYIYLLYIYIYIFINSGRTGGRAGGNQHRMPRWVWLSWAARMRLKVRLKSHARPLSACMLASYAWFHKVTCIMYI